MKTYDTMIEALNDLKSKGYTEDMKVLFDGIDVPGKGLVLKPEDFEIDKAYRFEGMTNPADSSVVYAISSDKHGLKGTLVSAYGTYSDTMTDAMVRKLQN